MEANNLNPDHTATMLPKNINYEGDGALSRQQVVTGRLRVNGVSLIQ